MQTNKQLYMSAVANLITAFGGGTVLGKAVGVVQLPFVELGSLVAFFVGTVFGLFILLGPLKNMSWKKDLTVSLLGPLSSLALLCIYLFSSDKSGKVSGSIGIIFFLILSIRFAFWFLSRILRSDRLSHLNSRVIPLIEGLFHSGTIISLAFIAAGLVTFGLIGTLILDTICQMFGAALDYAQLDKSESTKNQEKKIPEVSQMNSISKVALPISVFSLTTIMVQVIVFHCSHLLPHSQGLNYIGTFYFSLAFVGLLGAKMGVSGDFDRGLFGSAVIGTDRTVHISNIVLMLLMGLPIIYLLKYGINEGGTLPLVAVFIASSAYEAFSFGILHRIGKLGKDHFIDRAVARAFGIMALAACVAMFLMRIMNMDTFACIAVTFAFIPLSLLFLWLDTRSSSLTSSPEALSINGGEG